MIKRPLPVIGCTYLISLAVVFLYSSLSGEQFRPQGLFLAAAVVPVVGCVICVLLRLGKNILRVALICCVVFSFGTLYALYRTVTVPGQASALYGQKASITARLDDTAGISGSRYHYVVFATDIAVYNPTTERYEKADYPQTVRMRLTVPAPLDATYGDKLTAVVNITQPYPVANNNPYVIRDADGILAFCYAYGEVSYQSPTQYPPLAQLRSLRDRMRTAIERAVGGEPGAVAAAVLTGDKSGVPQHILRAFRASGLSHLLAVSGLHVTILTQFLLLILTLLRCPRRLSGILCMVALLLFCAFAGFTASVVRAAVMASALFFARLFYRRYDPVNAVSFSALIICITNPSALVSLSFILSFAATLSIVLLAPSLNALFERVLPWLYKHGKWAVQAGTLSLSATLFTYPVTAAVFGGVSLIGPVVNVLVLLLIPPLTVLTLLTGIAGVAGLAPIADALGFCTRILMLMVLRISDFFASLDFAYAKASVVAVCIVSSLSVLLAVVVRLVKRKNKHAPALITLAAVLLCMGGWFAYSQNSTDVIIALPDAGVSQTAVLHRGGGAAVIAGVDTKNRASSASYYVTENALSSELLLVPCLTDSAAAVVRETTKRAPAHQTLLANDTIRARELTTLTEGVRLIEPVGITTHTLLEGVTCYLDKREPKKGAVYLAANGVSVLFLYNGTDAAGLVAWMRSPDVCVISGKMPKNLERIGADYYIVSEAVLKKHKPDFLGKAMLSPVGDNPLVLRCGTDGRLRLEDAAIDVYR